MSRRLAAAHGERRSPRARDVQIPRAAAFAALAALLVLVVAQVAACGGTVADPFVGSWWEPTTGRRIVIKQTGDAYSLSYGADKRPYPATRKGDGLHVRQPFGAALVVKTTSGGGLVLVSGGTSTRLERAPQHQ